MGEASRGGNSWMGQWVGISKSLEYQATERPLREPQLTQLPARPHLTNSGMGPLPWCLVPFCQLRDPSGGGGRGGRELSTADVLGSHLSPPV